VNCLGIETSGTQTGLALVRDSGIITRTRACGTTHNEHVLPMLAELLAEAGIGPKDLTAIGVTAGPGMFTSLRVGLSTAKGLALPHSVPVKAVGTLPALAHSSPHPASCTLHLAPCTSSPPVLALIDARKSEVYAALYDGSRELLAPCVLSPSALPAVLHSALSALHSTLVLSGSGVPLCLDALRSAGVAVEDTQVRHPSAAAVARLALALIDAEGPDDLARLEPLYLRRTDAELNREVHRRGGAAGTPESGRGPQRPEAATQPRRGSG
jgi:tRNA threonylcarbamoyladenosine biosynthesis protein TsaB